jgi:hypothetical protein
LDLSDIAINRIKKADVHFDRKSYEQNTRRTNPKYKLFSLRLLNSFMFFLFMSDKASCSVKFRVCVYQNDFISKKTGHLENKFSYIDASKPDILSKNQIVQKINDPKNRFENIGKMKNRKIRTILYLLKKSNKHPTFSPDRIEKIKTALSFFPKENVERLGLGPKNPIDKPIR